MVVLIVLVNVLGDEPGGDAGNPASVGGTPTPERADLPVLPVDVPPVTAEAQEHCPAVMSGLPLELTGERSRRVDSDTLFAYAWGEPPIVLVCGVDRPEGFVVGTGTIQINGVQWYVDTSDPGSTVWTTVDRPVNVQVTVPPDTDSAPVTVLSTRIAEALPYVEPQPGG